MHCHPLVVPLSLPWDSTVFACVCSSGVLLHNISILRPLKPLSYSLPQLSACALFLSSPHQCIVVRLWGRGCPRVFVSIVSFSFVFSHYCLFLIPSDPCTVMIIHCLTCVLIHVDWTLNLFRILMVTYFSPFYFFLLWPLERCCLSLFTIVIP